MFSKGGLDNFIKYQWNERGVSLEEGQRVGVPVQELVELSRNRNFESSNSYVDLWVGVLDEFISWHISLLTVVYASRKEQITTDFSKAITSILMKVISDSTALRHLVLLGFDTSAKTLLRSTAEYMELLVAIIDSPDLAIEFVSADTPEKSNKFWKDHLAYGRRQEKLRIAWQDFFGQVSDTGAAEEFASWGNSWSNILSSLIHPSYMGGVFSAIPLKEAYCDDDWLGIWGDKSEASVQTIFIYSAFMFPVFILNRKFPFEGFELALGNGGIPYDSSDEFHRHVKIGRDVLASLVLSLSSEMNAKHVFPKIDMSIWKP